MRVHSKAALAVVLVLPALLTGCKPVAELAPEQMATVRVGDLFALRVDSERRYAFGAGGDSIALVKRADERGTTVYLYRAVAPGRQVLVLTPRDPGPDGCISCVTVHYFITIER